MSLIKDRNTFNIPIFYNFEMLLPFFLLAMKLTFLYIYIENINIYLNIQEFCLLFHFNGFFWSFSCCLLPQGHDINFLVHKTMRHYRFKSVSNTICCPRHSSPWSLQYCICNSLSYHTERRRVGECERCLLNADLWWWDFSLWITTTPVKWREARDSSPLHHLSD